MTQSWFEIINIKKYTLDEGSIGQILKYTRVVYMSVSRNICTVFFFGPIICVFKRSKDCKRMNDE